MDLVKQIKIQKQHIAQYEKSLALEKLKKRRADTRRKIEFGGLVIKSGLGDFNKPIILGCLHYCSNLIAADSKYKKLFQARGEAFFLQT